MSIKYDFYLASPFFNEEQKERERRVCSILREAGYDVYAPFENGVLTPDSGYGDRVLTFQNNIDAIKESKTVFAITDGKDVGTIWEAGFGYGIEKPVYFFCETLPEGAPFNIMLGVSARGIFLSEKELREAVANGFNKNWTYMGMAAQ